jgi:hypothetical protein
VGYLGGWQFERKEYQNEVLTTLSSREYGSLRRKLKAFKKSLPFEAAMNRRIVLSVLSVFMLVFSGNSWAQFAQRGGLGGTVFDPSNAVVPDAQITLHDLGQNQTWQTKSDAAGHFEFNNLTAGQYQLTASVQGFQSEKSQPITVNIGAIAQYDFKLHPGSVAESVTVTAEAVAPQTDQVNVNTNVSAQQLSDLPLNGRNFTSIAALAPGVSTTPQLNINPGGTYSVGAQFAMGGTAFTTGGSFQGSRDNGFYVNGVNITDNYVSSISYQPSAEALSTGTIQVADFSASNGHDISTLTMQTKGGTSSLHGEAFEFMENDAFNAVNPYDKATSLELTGEPATKPALRRNQFGGGLGGPIYIPKLLPSFKDKLFFFANYEKFIEHEAGQQNYASVPSAAERTGDFSELLSSTTPLQLYNPFYTTYDANGYSSRPIVPNNRLDLASRPDGSPAVDPGSAQLLALWPLPNIPNTPSNQLNYAYKVSPGFSVYHLDTRFDAVITKNDSVFVTWSQTHGTNNTTGGITPSRLYIGNNDDKAYLVTVNYAHVFNPRLTNEFIFGIGNGALQTQTADNLSYLNSDQNPLNHIFQNTGPGLTHGVLQVNVPNYASPGFGEVFRAENQTFQISDNLDWVRGRHSLTFGLNYFQKGEYDWDFVRYVNFGAFSSGGYNQDYVGGDSMADVVMGIPADSHQRYDFAGGDSTAPEADEAFPYWGFYVSDKFRATPNLTISAGIRYDLVIPIFARNNLCCAVYSSTADGGVLKIPGIASGLPQRYLSPAKLDFAPRVSIAYSLNPQRVIRAGYGIFYNAGATQISTALGNALNGTPGYFSGDDLNNVTLGYPSDTPAVSLSQVFQTAPTLLPGEYPVSTGKGEGYFGDGTWSSITYNDQKSTPLPYYQRFILDLQQQVASHDVITLSYVGALGRKGTNVTNTNLPPYATGWATANDFDAARPNSMGRFGDIYVTRPTLSSSYNAAIVQYRHEFSHNFQFMSNYTWGKTISDYPWINNLAGAYVGAPGSGFQYPNLNDRGESTLSHPQRFVYSGIWSPQYGAAWSPWAKIPFTGWRISGIGTLESGDSLTIVNGQTTAADNAGADEMFVSGNPNLSHGKKSFAQQFNTSAFTLPSTGVRGNSGLGTVRGPGQNNVDLSIAKVFQIYDDLHLEFRADAFNVFNHTQWNAVQTNYYLGGDPIYFFGHATGAREARIGQLGLKLFF